MAAVASRRLVGTSWVLARLDDPTGSVSPFPSGGETLTFEATTVSDNHGNNTFVRVEPETIRFQCGSTTLSSSYRRAPRVSSVTNGDSRSPC